MKSLIQYILTAFICVIAFSCSNDFLRNDPDLSISADMGIFLSPQWEATDYSVHVQNAGNAKFSVIKTPDWLQVNTQSGQFSNGVATINCNASVRSDFSATGIYNATMILNIEGIGKCLVPVSYINEGNPVIQADANITMHYDYYSSYSRANLNIGNTGDGILLWNIKEKPDWISINLPGGISLSDHATLYPIPQYGSISLDVLYNSNTIPSNDLQGKIVIASNDKNHSETVVNVSFNLGTPSLFLYIYNNELNFGRTQTNQTISLNNYGNGLLTWKIDSIPAWLSVSDTSGILPPYYSGDLTFTCNRSLMPNGEVSQTIYLKTNDPNYLSYPIAITAINYTANPDNISAITGTVTDAWADKTADILYLTTSQPNRLLAYNIKTKTFDRELALSKAPTCFSVSEDGHQAVIGHGGLISVVNMDNFSVTKTIETDNIIHAIEWGTDNWFCYIKANASGYYYLLWQNIDTGETYYTINNNYGSLDDQMFLKKIPHQDYIIASIYYRTSVFSTQTRDYVKEFNYQIVNFWFSSDGNYLFSSNNQIYKTSAILTSPNYYISPIGSFSPVPSSIFWIDHSSFSHSVWILSNSSNYYDSSQQEIQQYEDNDYTRVKTYYYDESYNGSPAQAQYVFANSAGSEVLVIKNNDQNAWSIEHIPVIN